MQRHKPFRRRLSENNFIKILFTKLFKLSIRTQSRFSSTDAIGVTAPSQTPVRFEPPPRPNTSVKPSKCEGTGPGGPVGQSAKTASDSDINTREGSNISHVNIFMVPDSEKAQKLLQPPVVSDPDEFDTNVPSSHKMKNTDSGYSSLASTPTKNENQSFELKVFPSMEVPKELDDRFFDLKMLYSQPLLETVSKVKMNHGDISMKLKYMGTQEETAELYIVIHCDKRVSKRVKTFFNQKHVLEDLKSDFQVCVMGTGLVSLSTFPDLLTSFTPNLGSITVQCHVANRTTSCGTTLIMSYDISPVSVATLGGLIMAKDNTGSYIRLWGITAGHAAARTLGKEYRHPIESTANASSVESHDDESDDEDDAYHVDGASDKHEGHSLTLDLTVRDEDLNASTVGWGLIPLPGEANYDWSLIMGLSNGAGNFLQHDGQPARELFCEQIVSLGRRETRRVVVMTGRGYQRGTLTANGTTMVSSIGKAFVYAFDFVPNAESSKSSLFES